MHLFSLSATSVLADMVSKTGLARTAEPDRAGEERLMPRDEEIKLRATVLVPPV